MNKAIIVLLLILTAAFSFGKVSSYANENKDINELKLNKAVKIDNQSDIFRLSVQIRERQEDEEREQNKNKTQFRIKDNHNDEDSEFMIKGVIASSSSGSIVIDSKTIKIDPSVTGKVKIVGKLEIGAYAMAKGIVKNSDLYAEKIVVNQRNKNDIEENEDDDDKIRPSISPTPTPSVTPIATSSSTVEGDENREQKKELTLNRLILSLENILSSLRKFVLGI